MNALYALVSDAYTYMTESKKAPLPPHESEAYGYLISPPGAAAALRIPGWMARELATVEEEHICLKQVKRHPRGVTFCSFPEDMMGIRRDALASHVVVIHKADKPHFLQHMRDQTCWYQCTGENERFLAYSIYVAQQQRGACYAASVLEHVNLQQDARCLSDDLKMTQLSVTWKPATPPETCLAHIESMFEKFYLGSPDAIPGPLQHRVTSEKIEMLAWKRPQCTVAVRGPRQTIDMLLEYLTLDEQIYHVQCAWE